jgi:hypothetical protein
VAGVLTYQGDRALAVAGAGGEPQFHRAKEKGASRGVLGDEPGAAGVVDVGAGGRAVGHLGQVALRVPGQGLWPAGPGRLVMLPAAS